MRHIHTEIEIQASRGRVWEILTDLGAYSAWNPLIPEACGEVRVGGVLHVQICPPDMSMSRYALRVTGVRPFQEFRWLGHFILPGLMNGDHRFVLEELSPNRTRLVQSETFTGLLVPVCGSWLVARMRRGFERMNEALKGRAEGITGASAGPSRRPEIGRSFSSLKDRATRVC